MGKRVKKTIRMARVVIYKETLVDFNEHLWTFIGSFTGIGLIGFIQSLYLSAADNLFLVGSFGATSVLLYGVMNSPMAQPRNVIGGHVISATLGVLINLTIPYPWLSAALAVSSSIVVMQVTKTLHPPGGATALIAVIGSEKIKTLGFFYVLSPILSGVAILMLIAFVFNNISAKRSYPNNKSWYKVWQRRYF